MGVHALGVDPQVLGHVWDTLAVEGYQPVVTRDPEEALHLIEEERLQLALLYLMMTEAPNPAHGATGYCKR